MSFSSVSFIVFMIAVFFIYWEIPHKFRYILLIFANLCFYGSFGIKCLPVLLGQALITYLFSFILEKKKTKSLLAAGIILVPAQLLVFKYLNFSIYTIDKVMGIISAPVHDHTIKLLAPIGISFYTFESLSYIIDVYKGEVKAERNFLKVFVFLSFFPNITSGPIERAGHFFKSLETEREFDYDRTVRALRLMLLGFLKKICGADVLHTYVDSVFGNVYAYNGVIFIVAGLLYTYEIYLDFSGYTDIARGCAYMLGFELPINFKAPYLSCSVKEFFARWHISLSKWLKDYIYIPLGGSRCTRARKCLNLMITFLVSGIWHGASFTFIAWGMLHGVYQCVSELLGTRANGTSKEHVGVTAKRADVKESGIKKTSINYTKMQINRIVRTVFTFILVSFAWIFFRANSLSDVKYILTNIISVSDISVQMQRMGFMTFGTYAAVILIIVFTVIYDVVSEKGEATDLLLKLPSPMRFIIYVLLGTLIVTMYAHSGRPAEFIYLKF